MQQLTLRALAANCPHLQQLHIWSMEETEYDPNESFVLDIESVLIQCLHISHLTLDTCKRFPQSLARAIAARCPRLLYLKAGAKGTVSYIVTACRNLTHLDISRRHDKYSYTKHNTDQPVMEVDTLAAIGGRHCTELTNTSHSEQHIGSNVFSDVSIDAIAERLQQVAKSRATPLRGLHGRRNYCSSGKLSRISDRAKFRAMS